MRKDVTWEDVIRNYATGRLDIFQVTLPSLTFLLIVVPNDPNKESKWLGTKGRFLTFFFFVKLMFRSCVDYFLRKKSPDRAASFRTLRSRRDVLMQFAKAKGFDPLVPENWYNIRRSDVKSFKVRSSIYTDMQALLLLLLGWKDFVPL